MQTLLLLFSACCFLGGFPKTPDVGYFAEICDNALDDDGDGLIDLNDPDCDCPAYEPLSLIPNPSFEETECCPSNRSQLNCATGWIQASEATTDFLHECGWLGWADLPVPLPMPDGQGCMGFRNGRPGGPNGDGPNPNWKEYAGACLLNPLKAGVTYRFEFYIGFTHAWSSPATSIVFFGTPDCGNLPFGVGNDNFGCPTNGFGWMDLGSVFIQGANQWKKTEITVTPVVDIHAIAIGPNCLETPSSTSYYYFFDNLVLAEQSAFEFQISSKGNPCNGTATLSMPHFDTLQYQWYKDGVALVGATGPELGGDLESGNYQVRIVGPNSCRVTQAYPFRIPVSVTEISGSVCQGEAYFFGGQNLTESGTYVDTLLTGADCDSIVRLNLEVVGELSETVYAKIMEGESWRLGAKKYSVPGEYDAVLTSSLGCDSMVHLVLDYYKIFIPNAFSPNGDGLNDVFTIFTGEDVLEEPEMKIFDRWGGLVFESDGLRTNGLKAGWDGTSHDGPASPGVYVFEVFVIFDDGKKRLFKGEINLLR